MTIPKEFIENKETICTSVNNSKLFDLGDDSKIKWNEIKEAIPHPDFDQQSNTVEVNLIFDNDETIRTSLLPCKWTPETSQNGWFYLGLVHNFNGYILLKITEDQQLPNQLVGHVLEFLNLQQVEDDSDNIFGNMFTKYVRNQCK